MPSGTHSIYPVNSHLTFTDREILFAGEGNSLAAHYPYCEKHILVYLHPRVMQGDAVYGVSA